MIKRFSLLPLLLFLLNWGDALAQTTAPLPPHSNVFAGNVRGYWFTAPSCFTITALEVASEAGAGNQNIAVCRLPSPPPIFSATTNVFTTLFVTQNNPATGAIPVNIPINAGEHIMILGQRGTNNSYSATGSWTTTINGQTVPIYRCGMQFQLPTTLPQDLWAQASGSVSRVHMTYTASGNYTASAAPVGPGGFNLSTNADTSATVVWDYGDGSALDTIDAPYHAYPVAGPYTACAYISSVCDTDTVCVQLTSCGGFPLSQWSFGQMGPSVSFTDSSDYAVSWSWNFGDGSTDTTQNPTHTYAAFGWYNVCLEVTNACGSTDMYCDSILVCSPPSAGIGFSLTGRDTAVFVDNSMYGTAWMWDFGDGTTDTTQNPTHVYTSSGTYNYCLITSNLCGVDTLCGSVTVCVTPPVAAFSSSGSQFTYTFTNTSTGSNSYMWDFGDGDTSAAMNPTHTYLANGTYVVCLTVGNDCNESATTCDTLLVNVIGIDPAMAGFEIQMAPNPVIDRVGVTVRHHSVSGNYTLEIMDLTGRVVTVAEGLIGQQKEIDLRAFAAGSYVYRVIVDGNHVGAGKIQKN